MAQVDANVRSLKWKLWHGQTDRALDQLETMTRDFAKLRERGNLSATRLLHLAHPLLTYVRSNKSAIINYGARYRSGRRIATALAESGVNSLVARRMVKKQQMQWSKRGAHLLLQVRAAVLNGDLRERLTYKPPKRAHRSRIAWLFEPTRRCSRRPNTPANLSVPSPHPEGNTLACLPPKSRIMANKGGPRPKAREAVVPARSLAARNQRFA